MFIDVTLLLVAVWAGIQNALAGGGTFITFPALLMSGLDPRAANITSTIALFPGQVTTALAGRAHVAGAPQLSVRALIGISLVGGVVGAALLLLTPPEFFQRLVPFLVLLATGIFAWGSFAKTSALVPKGTGRSVLGWSQFAIAIYGGYFGGGIGILMLAALTAVGMQFRNAGATKNVLVAVMNAAAVGVFAFSHDVHWFKAAIVGAGSMVGGRYGAYLLTRVNVQLLRLFVIAVGLMLGIALLWRAYG